MSPAPAARVAHLKRTLIREIFESAPPDAINLGLGQPDLRPPAVLEEALARASAEGPAGYGPTQGDRVLRDLVAQTYPGFAADGTHVVITTGCQEATFVVLGALADPGDEVLVPDPGFPGADRAADAWGAKPVRYPLPAERDFHLDPEDVIARIRPKTRAVVVITPSNPTGTVEPAATLDMLVEATAARGVALVIDDTYRHLHWLADGPAPGAPLHPAPHVVVCGGLSKSAALTGWRVGWAICSDASFVARLVALQQTVLTCAATPIQIAARAAFSPEGLLGTSAIRARFHARMKIVERALAPTGVAMAPLEGAFYAWLNVGAQGGGRAFSRALLDEDKVVIIPGEAFGTTSPDWVRIGYAQDEALLERALAAIARRLVPSES